MKSDSIFYCLIIQLPLQGQEGKPKYQEILASFDESKNEPIDFEDFMVQTLSITLMSDLLEDIKKCAKK